MAADLGGAFRVPPRPGSLLLTVDGAPTSQSRGRWHGVGATPPNTAWEGQADGTLEERTYDRQNWRVDVVALMTYRSERHGSVPPAERSALPHFVRSHLSLRRDDERTARLRRTGRGDEEGMELRRVVAHGSGIRATRWALPESPRCCMCA